MVVILYIYIYNILVFSIWFSYLTTDKISIKYCIEKKISTQILSGQGYLWVPYI